MSSTEYKILNPPSKIYLVTGLDKNDLQENATFNELSEVTWCNTKEYHHDIEYVLSTPPQEHPLLHREVEEVVVPENLLQGAFDSCFDWELCKLKDYSQKEIEHDIKEAIKQGIEDYILSIAGAQYQASKASVSEGRGLIWVKASDNLPPSPDSPYYHFRIDGDKVNGNFHDTEHGVAFTVTGSTFDDYTVYKEHFHRIEWLSEQPNNTQEKGEEPCCSCGSPLPTDDRYDGYCTDCA